MPRKWDQSEILHAIFLLPIRLDGYYVSLKILMLALDADCYVGGY